MRGDRNPIQLAVFIVALVASMWGISELVSVREQTRDVILGIGFFVLLLLALWRKIPLDAKLLFIVVLGYALGGKGFAYVSPFEPVYIGEICLALCVCGFAFRVSQWGLADTALHKWIWIYLVYAGVHLILDFQEYKLLAIRDGSTVYYSLYFVTAFVLFKNQTILDTFERILKVALVLSIVQVVIYSTSYSLTGQNFTLPGFIPSVDAYIPVTVGASLYYLVKGMEGKKIHYIVVGCLVSSTLFSGKTTGLVAFAVVMIGAIFHGRVKGLLIPALLLAMVGVVAVALVLMVMPDLLYDSIGSGETAQAFGVESGQFVGFTGTSSWRWDWWMIIWDDTMAIAPFWGLGFGSDISSSFLIEWLGEEIASNAADDYARYPHNVLFTIIGRLGLVGLVIFSGVFISIGLLAIRFCKRYFQSSDRRDADLITYGIVVAGMVNGLLQATYEVPHAAIIHWICLGYMATRYYRPKLNLNHEAT